jgi:hypothetical protein
VNVTKSRDGVLLTWQLRVDSLLQRTQATVRSRLFVRHRSDSLPNSSLLPGSLQLREVPLVALRFPLPEGYLTNVKEKEG